MIDIQSSTAPSKRSFASAVRLARLAPRPLRPVRNPESRRSGFFIPPLKDRFFCDRRWS